MPLVFTTPGGYNARDLGISALWDRSSGSMLVTLAASWLLSWLVLVVAARRNFVLSVSGAALCADRDDALTTQTRVRDGFRRAWRGAVVLAAAGIWLIVAG